ncbi:hypothetical protein [Tissierella praeacuta]|uniref:hypothetical protein n=1 Tax=Tissierella praeacuta TaxID=43131 RepID=UPI0028B12489|nr:hypothetical protein [Tissierella praeacuta]
MKWKMIYSLCLSQSIANTILGKFNVYVKYSMIIRNTKVNINSRIKKNISCTNEKLNETYMAVLGYKEAMKCLEKSTNKGTWRIRFIRIGTEYNFYYHGFGFNEKGYIKIL